MSATLRAALLPLALCALAAAPAAGQDGGHLASPPAARPATRAADGSPGPAYWQQRVDYRLEASLDPAARVLRGSGWITYHNRSPDALRELHWHLYQNLFRPDAPERAGLWSVGARVATTRGITVQRLEAEGVPLDPRVDGTRMATPLAAPLAPGDSLRLRVEWEYEVPDLPDLRTGSKGADFGMAQWYPQVAVYDDVRGWDDAPYRGRGEFYLEYGDWDVRLSVPGSYVVAATGTLENPEEVLTARQSERLRSVSADTVLPVIPYLETGVARRGLAGSRRTWHFRARNVRDFAWAASPEFVWDATRSRGPDGSGVLVSSFYRASDAAAWTEGAVHARRAIEYFGERIGPYAYPQATVVSGPVRGMEYPMLAFADAGGSEHLVVHEVGHQWFPMAVGSDEGRHPFMDEGLATFLTSLAMDDPARAQGPAGERLLNRELYLMFAGIFGGPPVATPADSASSALSYLATAYLKSSAVIFMLRDVVGPDVLQEALREYHRRWRFRHPYPEDFFRTVEDVSGRDLGWFWDQWVRGTASLDFAVDDVRQRRSRGGWRAEIDLVSRDAGTMPATVRLSLADGTRRDLRVPEDAWRRGEVHEVVEEGLPARVVRVEVDPARILPDAVEANNRWPAPVTLLAERSRIRREVGASLLLDERRLSWHPAFGSNEVDGFEVGVVSLHRVGSAEGRLQTMLRVGTRSRRADVWLGYEAPLAALGPVAAWGVQGMEIDGRVGGDLEVQVARRPRGQRSDSSVVDRRLWLGIHSVALRDARYLPADEAQWDDGWLTAGTARMRVPRVGWWGTGAGSLELEAGLPGSDWTYAKLGAEARTRRPLGWGTTLGLRAFAGASLGDLPAQTAFSLAQATAWERWARLRHVRGRGDASGSSAAAACRASPPAPPPTVCWRPTSRSRRGGGGSPASSSRTPPPPSWAPSSTAPPGAPTRASAWGSSCPAATASSSASPSGSATPRAPTPTRGTCGGGWWWEGKGCSHPRPPSPEIGRGNGEQRSDEPGVRAYRCAALSRSYWRSAAWIFSSSPIPP